MRVLKALLTLALVVGLVGAAGFAVGVVVGHHGQHTAASAKDVPVLDLSTSPTPSPPSTSATPSHRPSHVPVPAERRPRAKGPRVRDDQQPLLRPGPTILGPGDAGPGVRAVQARLKQIDWYVGDVTGSYDEATATAIKGFQAKRGIPVTGSVDRRTLDRLEGMTSTPTHDALHNIVPSPGRLDPRCLTGHVMCIDKTSSTLRWVVDGHVRQTLDARFGSTLNNTPTREGLFHVYLKDADHVSQLYGSSMPFAMFFSGGQAVHYSSDFAAVGYAGASHGCVNIRDYDGIAWLFSQVRVGDKVVVYWS
jgi:peptidoglycan hydrolase-like protein with peptidoglycan-binding domain